MINMLNIKGEVCRLQRDQDRGHRGGAEVRRAEDVRLEHLHLREEHGIIHVYTYIYIYI